MNNPKGTVLIVDDTPANLALLSDTLSEAQYRVLVATDGLSAIEQISYSKPDIILLDVIMPGIDGFETCNRLKSNPDTLDIPVLFMTGLSELDDLLRGFSEGGLDYIVKPIRPAEVLARIEVHLQQTRNRLRAEQLIHHNDFAALVVDNQGIINWLTPAAEQWLNHFSQEFALLPCAGINDALPSKLLSAFQQWSQQITNVGSDATEFKLGSGFSLNMSPCENERGYLLLLHHESDNWTPENLKEKLKLTFREAEILMWISRGKTNKEIGLILSTSPRTVNKHLEHIFEKLGVSTRAAAIAKVLQSN
jgi:DNA-binding response OmpR family regulator/DNA-binding CsgD family transcriptional regulator